MFASDAISSTAYATQEILIVLVPAVGLAATDYLVPLAFVVCVLLAIVITSYRQTIMAYPGGGGTYIVSRENLGPTIALVAGASILVDYVLTVAVSVSAGVAAITSAFPDLAQYRVGLCLGFIALMTVANLRGLKESGILFAPRPTSTSRSLFVHDRLGPLPVLHGRPGAAADRRGGLDRGDHRRARRSPASASWSCSAAFSSGAVALTGVEAIADGVPAFKKPESRNAARTLVTMAVILGIGFFGLALLANRLNPTASEDETLLSILGSAVFGGGHPALLRAAVLDLRHPHPGGQHRLRRLPAAVVDHRPGRVPAPPVQEPGRPARVLQRHRRAGRHGRPCLIVVFGGETTALIPLYAVGVFTGFTLSQAGMVRYQRRERAPGWQLRMVVNLVGAIATGVVLLVVVVSKFTIGAWLPAVVIPAIVVLFRAIGRHYAGRAGGDQRDGRVAGPPPHPHGRRARRQRQQGDAARARLRPLPRAGPAPRRQRGDRRRGGQRSSPSSGPKHDIPVELHTLHSPYRNLTRPVLRFLDELDAESRDDIITVVIPEFVVNRWYPQVLHNQTALALKARLLFRPHTVVTSVPVHIGEPES